MKKLLFSVFVSLFAFSATTVYAKPLTEKQIQKEAKKEAKKLEKEGWKVTPGSLSLERQMEKSITIREAEDELGYPKYYIGTSQPIAEFYDAAKLQANMVALRDLASRVSARISAVVQEKAGNKQLSHDEAASIEQVVANSTQQISGKFGQTIPLMECSRKLPNGNTQMMVVIAYPTSKALDEAKEAIREKLEQEAKELAEKFEKVVKF